MKSSTRRRHSLELTRSASDGIVRLIDKAARRKVKSLVVEPSIAEATGEQQAVSPTFGKNTQKEDSQGTGDMWL